MASRTVPPLPTARLWRAWRPSAGAPPAPATRAALARLRPRLVATVLAVLLLVAGGWWLGRDSSLVAVREVRITGLTAAQSSAVRTALTQAAQDMTTLHVRDGVLRDAVQGFPVVADVRAHGSFPHLLRITVTEHRPVAVLQAGGASLPVAGDGTLLRGVLAPGLPTVAVKAPPAGVRLRDPLALAQVRILGAAPAPLRSRVSRMFTGARGLEAQLRDGPAVAFGAADRLAAKWAALTAVLADPSSAGASLIDVTVPESPAAAGLEPVASSATASPAPTGTAPTPAASGPLPAAPASTPPATAP